mgnify:CR=1 FL=1
MTEHLLLGRSGPWGCAPIRSASADDRASAIAAVGRFQMHGCFQFISSCFRQLRLAKPEADWKTAEESAAVPSVPAAPVARYLKTIRSTNLPVT